MHTYVYASFTSVSLCAYINFMYNSFSGHLNLCYAMVAYYKIVTRVHNVIGYYIELIYLRVFHNNHSRSQLLLLKVELGDSRLLGRLLVCNLWVVLNVNMVMMLLWRRRRASGGSWPILEIDWLVLELVGSCKSV